MTKLFDRMRASVFRTFGDDALHNGAPARVILEEGVVVTGEYGEVTAYRTMVTFERPVVTPKAGDSVVVDGKSFVVDAIESNDGNFVACFVR